MPKTTLRRAPAVAESPSPPCADVGHWDLAEQLRLSRLQAAYLHRELANARLQAPMAPTDASPEDQLQLEVEHLRQRLGTLKLHYEDAQRKIEWLQYDLRVTRKALGWSRDTESLPGIEAQVIASALTQLLTIAHPDRWSQGQPATELAHELAVAINEQRARLG